MKNIAIENIKVGDAAEITKLMSFDLVSNFAKISEDFNPIHMDPEFALRSRYKRQIVHGLIATSLFSGLFGSQLPGVGCVYKSQNIRFRRPIYLDDCVLARIEVVKVESVKRTVSFSTRCIVDGKLVVDGEAEIFIP